MMTFEEAQQRLRERGPLPGWHPITEEIPAPPSFKLEEWGPGVQFPPIQKMPDGRLIVQWWDTAQWWKESPKIMCKVWTPGDHPNMAALPDDAPRAVRAAYLASNQLAMLRGNYDSSIAAMEAWQRYSLGGVTIYDVIEAESLS